MRPAPGFHPAGPPMQGGPHGYQGLQGILQALSGPIGADQYQRLLSGYTGRNGAIGGMHGAFSGLSPYAVNFIAQNLLQKKAPNQIDTTGLSGDELFRAQLQNQLSGMAPAQYELHSGIDQGFLQQLLSGGIGGHGAYAHGFNANGAAGPIGRDNGFLPPQSHGHGHAYGRNHNGVPITDGAGMLGGIGRGNGGRGNGTRSPLSINAVRAARRTRR